MEKSFKENCINEIVGEATDLQELTLTFLTDQFSFEKILKAEDSIAFIKLRLESIKSEFPGYYSIDELSRIRNAMNDLIKDNKSYSKILLDEVGVSEPTLTKFLSNNGYPSFRTKDLLKQWYNGHILNLYANTKSSYKQ